MEEWVDRRRWSQRLIAYSVYAWGVPVLIVTVGQILDHWPDLPDYIVTPNLGQTNAWFGGARVRYTIKSPENPIARELKFSRNSNQIQ